ncbi:hypothetical protein QR680_012731 [Steinernema hermaphroditum]|uniref:Uncharacterized protein n=1 Tax=Steinernema hermaphroditum TaxID=289476 RepID=A0AA39I2Y4_9BILA|nr:hypothetical protein QR680_012731 [Steinernema hermaphroditum]
MHVSAHPELNTTGLNGGGHRLSRTIERSGARDASESIPTLEANANFENMSGDEAQSPKKAVHEPNDSIKCLLEAFKEKVVSSVGHQTLLSVCFKEPIAHCVDS